MRLVAFLLNLIQSSFTLFTASMLRRYKTQNCVSSESFCFFVYQFLVSSTFRKKRGINYCDALLKHFANHNFSTIFQMLINGSHTTPILFLSMWYSFISLFSKKLQSDLLLLSSFISVILIIMNFNKFNFIIVSLLRCQLRYHLKSQIPTSCIKSVCCILHDFLLQMIKISGQNLRPVAYSQVKSLSSLGSEMECHLIQKKDSALHTRYKKLAGFFLCDYVFIILNCPQLNSIFPVA